MLMKTKDIKKERTLWHRLTCMELASMRSTQKTIRPTRLCWDFNSEDLPDKPNSGHVARKPN